MVSTRRSRTPFPKFSRAWATVRSPTTAASFSASPEGLARLLSRAGIPDTPPSPYRCVDRQGQVRIPTDDAILIAQRFAAAEPAAVLANVEATERKWSSDASRAGNEYLVSLLNEYRAAWSLVRQWAGHDSAIAHREAEIQKLERLVWDAVYALEKAGLDEPARRLRRVIDHR